MAEIELAKITNYLAISERLGTGGQPRPRHFTDLAQAGYQVVINLAMPELNTALVDEDWLVAQKGMMYVHLPIPWMQPTQVHVVRFMDIMDCFRSDKVFVHCMKNMRVSALVYVYRVCRLGLPVTVARTDMLKIWRPYGVWAELIDTALAGFGAE